MQIVGKNGMLMVGLVGPVWGNFDKYSRSLLDRLLITPLYNMFFRPVKANLVS